MPGMWCKTSTLYSTDDVHSSWSRRTTFTVRGVDGRRSQPRERPVLRSPPPFNMGGEERSGTRREGYEGGGPDGPVWGRKASAIVVVELRRKIEELGGGKGGVHRCRRHSFVPVAARRLPHAKVEDNRDDMCRFDIGDCSSSAPTINK